MSRTALHRPHAEASPDIASPKPEIGSRLRAQIKSRLAELRGPRTLLLAGGVLIVLLGAGYFYLSAGRYVSTDNAYVKASKVMIAAEVSGTISSVAVRENEHVAKNQILFRIDDRNYRLALEQTSARLASVRDDIEGLKSAYRQKAEELNLARENLSFAKVELDRQTKLATTSAALQSKLDSAKHDVDVAAMRLAIAEHDLSQTRAQLNGNPDITSTDHPRYIDALAARDRAALDLEHTTVRAPFSGIASNVPTLGLQVVGNGALSAPVMSIVSDSNIWIEANFKETDIATVRPGQPVMINVDTFTGRTLRGIVASIGQATGAEFSIIPPQNATGNWVKVVQRVPLRIAVNNDDGLLLRAGMSTSVEIDTGRYSHLPDFLQSASAPIKRTSSRSEPVRTP